MMVALEIAPLVVGIAVWDVEDIYRLGCESRTDYTAADFGLDPHTGATHSAWGHTGVRHSAAR